MFVVVVDCGLLLESVIDLEWWFELKKHMYFLQWLARVCSLDPSCGVESVISKAVNLHLLAV